MNNNFLINRLRSLVLPWVVVVSMSAVANAAPVNDNTALVAKIHASQYVNRSGVGSYDSRSMALLSGVLSPADVPALLALYASDKETIGAQFAIASQCDAGLNGLMEAVRQGTLRHPDGSPVDFLEAKAVAFMISTSLGICGAEAAKQSRSAVVEILSHDVRQPLHLGNAAEQENHLRAEFIRQCIERLFSGRDLYLTPVERDQLLTSAAKAIHFDAPPTAAQLVVIDKVRHDMTVQSIPILSDQRQRGVSTSVATPVSGNASGAISGKDSAALISMIQSTEYVSRKGAVSYDMRSRELLADRFSPEDVPGLLNLFASGKETVRVQLALASQCTAGLDGITQAAQSGTLHHHDGSAVELAEASLLISEVAHFGRCDAQTRETAGEALKVVRVTAPDGYITCYSHNKEGGSPRGGDNTFAMGGLNMPESYRRKFQPAEYVDKDISQVQVFKDLCDNAIQSCKKGCWAAWTSRDPKPVHSRR